MNGMERVSFEEILGSPEKDVLAQIHLLCHQLFKDHDEAYLEERLLTKQHIFTVLAFQNQQLIAFKLGYQEDAHIFYSWIGGVSASYRRRGVAKALAQRQEIWAKERGFKRLRTKSKNQFKPMMIFNLNNGFDIVDTEVGRKNELKIVFEKAL